MPNCEICGKPSEKGEGAIIQINGGDLFFCNRAHAQLFLSGSVHAKRAVGDNALSKDSVLIYARAIEKYGEEIPADVERELFWDLYMEQGTTLQWTGDAYREYIEPFFMLMDARCAAKKTPFSVLEIGYGIGNNSYLLRHADSAVGLDISQKMLDFAPVNPEIEKLKHDIVFDTKFKDNEFEFGMSVKTLQHVPPEQIQDAVKNFARVCKNILVVESCHPNHAFESGYAFLHKNLADMFIDEGMYMARCMYPKEKCENTLIFFFTKDPLISIIVPSKDQAKFLKRCVDSVLDQDHENVEVIVVDSSIDESPELLKKYDDPRLRVFYEPACGLAHARNTGMKLAIGDFLIFLDSDDAMKYDRVRRQLAKFKDFPETGVVYTGMEIVDSEGKTQNIIPALPFNMEQWLPAQYIGISTCMFSRDAVVHVGLFDEHFKMCEDTDYIARVVGNRFPMLHVNEALTIYTTHDDAMTKNVYMMNKEFAKFVVKHKISFELALSRVQKFNNPNAIYAICDGYREACEIWGEYPDHAKRSQPK